LLGDLGHGAASPFRAVKLIRQDPRLRGLALVCAAVTFVALIGVIWVASRYSDDVLAFAWREPESSWRFLWQVARVLVWMLFVVVGANTVPLLLLAPLQDPLSEATEAALGQSGSGQRGRFSFLRDMVAAVTHTVQRIVLLLVGHALLLLLHVIPGLGSLVWTVLATLWTSFWLAAEYLDIPMARHLYAFGQVRSVLRQRWSLGLGLGLGLYALLWIPVLNLFLVPLAVVAGTHVFCGLRTQGSLPKPAREKTREREETPVRSN
jgi:CysZ protein